MLHRGEYDDDWEDEAEPDDEAIEEDDEEPTVACPYCRERIHEDAHRCPHCGEFISDEDRPAARQPWWIIIGALAVMYAVYRWTTG